MSALAFVLAAHFIGDWIMQTDWQAANKTTSWSAMSAHMSGYHLAIAAALVAAQVGLWRGVVIWCVSLATHAFIDRRWPVRWLMAHTGSAPFSETTWGVLVVDQALHLSILLILVGSLA